MRRTLAACLILTVVLASPALAAGRRFVIGDAYGCEVPVDEEGVLYTPEGVYRYIRSIAQGACEPEEEMFLAWRLAFSRPDMDAPLLLPDAFGQTVVELDSHRVSSGSRRASPPMPAFPTIGTA
ncbi:MAG: hypothetical protein GX647_13460 [Clostridiales bacterium]|nr:hypothetical protein [Clostridiales bacterium]OPZ68369.1 MAG: hypothetical protein BWY81_00862 [Firmicutes bacterium ADurb.Bin467]